jgi:type I restriction enzyme S subunit
MALKAGYKQTEVGVIPDDWDIKTFKDICWVNQGLQIVITKRLKHPAPQSKVYITIQYLHEGKQAEYIEEYTTSVCCNKDDILMTRTGNTGIVVSDVEGVFHNNFFKINYDKKKIHKNFLIYYLQQERTQKTILIKAGTSTIPDLNHNDFYSIHVPVPTLAEQEAIAAALSDADALIAVLEGLIAKKRQIKQGSMQELLTGKKRLQGFSGDWEEKVLSTITQVPITDGPHLTPRFIEDGYPFLSVNNLVDNKIDFSDLRYISFDDHVIFSRKCKPQRDDILLGKAASVGKVAIVDFDIEFDIWSPIALIRIDKKYNPKFVYYVFQGKEMIRQIEILTNSSSQGNISMGDIEKLIVPLPSKEEQTAIAEILSDMDAEIAALEGKLVKARQVKVGMMQELLTGKTRLVASGE